MAIVAERLARPPPLLEMHQKRSQKPHNVLTRHEVFQLEVQPVAAARGRRRRGRTCRRCGRRCRCRSGRGGRSRWGSRSCARSAIRPPAPASSAPLPTRRGCRAATARPRTGPGRTSGSPGRPCCASALGATAPAAERRARPASVRGPAKSAPPRLHSSMSCMRRQPQFRPKPLDNGSHGRSGGAAPPSSLTRPFSMLRP